MSLRRFVGTAAQRAASSQTGSVGDIALETDTGNIAIADGATPLNALKRLVRLDEVTTAVKQYMTNLVVNSTTLQALAAESGYIDATVDSNSRLVTGTLPDGTFYIPKALLGPNNVDTAQLSTAVQASLAAGGGVPAPVEGGFIITETDSNGRLIRGVTADGTNVGKGFGVDDASVTVTKLAADAAARLVPVTHDVLETTGTTPNRRVWVDTDATAQRTAITDGTVDSYNPKFSPDHQYVLYDSAAGAKYAPVAGGTSYPQLPVARISRYGDSLTAGGVGAADTALASALGCTVDNRGHSGWASRDIAMAQGGVIVSFTFAGPIPAGTSSVVATPTVTGGFRDDNSFAVNWSGSFLGIPGTLNHTNGVGWSFTRTSAGSSTPTPGTIPFVIDPTSQGAADQSNVQTIWVGRNNPSEGAIIQSDIAAMVAFLKPYQKRYLVFGVTKSLTEPTGSVNAARIDLINAALAATYGPRFFDINAYLVNSAMADMGLTPTGQDLTDVANGVPPTQLHLVTGGVTDAIHFSAATQTQIGVKLAALMQSKGWF